MAGGQERILRRRIRTVNATKKITRAMELIAASRIVRAQQRVHAAQPYSDQITEVVRDLSAAGDARPAAEAAGGYEFEPSPGEILESLVPRYLEARIYAALLNAAASQQAARQRAMKAATDNAEELIKSYTRIMNRARQDTITTEIMEIVGGAEALASDKRPARSEHFPIEFVEAQGASAS